MGYGIRMLALGMALFAPIEILVFIVAEKFDHAERSIRRMFQKRPIECRPQVVLEDTDRDANESR